MLMSIRSANDGNSIKHMQLIPRVSDLATNYLELQWKINPSKPYTRSELHISRLS